MELSIKYYSDLTSLASLSIMIAILTLNLIAVNIATLTGFFIRSRKVVAKGSTASGLAWQTVAQV